MGAEGARAIRGAETITCPGFKVSSIDSTGAGDSFNAGFLHAYLSGLELEACLRWGCACGALSTLRAGGIAGQPTVEEVEDFLAGQLGA
jgi:sugar/nucleoside kinase (ribokinase family)